MVNIKTHQIKKFTTKIKLKIPGKFYSVKSSLEVVDTYKWTLIKSIRQSISYCS